MGNNFYDSLGVNKTASAEEIKKAYRKKAMQYHPDKNKDDKKAEAKFKEINEAYQTLGDASARKQYDTFGSAKSAAGNPFGGGGGTGAGGFGGFEDIFGGMGGGRQQNSGFNFNMEDLFNQGGSGQGSPFGQQTQSRQAPKEPENLDFNKTYEVPIFDMILGCSIEILGVYGQKKKIKIPAGTKPGAKMRVKDFGKSEGTTKGNLLITLEAKMPKSISEVDKSMLERIRDGVGY